MRIWFYDGVGMGYICCVRKEMTSGWYRSKLRMSSFWVFSHPIWGAGYSLDLCPLGVIWGYLESLTHIGVVYQVTWAYFGVIWAHLGLFVTKHCLHRNCSNKFEGLFGSRTGSADFHDLIHLWKFHQPIKSIQFRVNSEDWAGNGFHGCPTFPPTESCARTRM